MAHLQYHERLNNKPHLPVPCQLPLHMATYQHVNQTNLSLSLLISIFKWVLAQKQLLKVKIFG
uniref:Uncharacterized protein n=1 Tax=Manihot esculenta TaxID=3983 RepID=A0A2C9UG28_MANES